LRLARAALVLALLAFLIVLGHTIWLRVDPDIHDSYVAALIDLRAVNARVNETVLKSRLGLTRSADPLAEMMRETAALHRELRNIPTVLAPGDRQRVLDLIEESARFQKERQRNVERFVGEDAALAASLRILAPETMKLAADIEATGGRTLADHARTLRVEVLELAAAREQGHIAAIQQAIAAVRDDDWPGAAERRAAERLVAHVNNVVQRRQRVDALTNLIVTEGALNRAIAIERAYAAGSDAARAAWQRNVVALFILALLALASASAYVIARLRASAEELGAATAQLTSALAALQAERAKEKELAELKTRFVAMTSHEFRTPLSVISSSAELIQNYGEKWSKERRGEHLMRIRRSVTGMTTMLERILLIGKTEAGMLEFAPAPVDLGALCLEIAHSIELADGGKHHLLTEVDPGVSQASADAKLVRHILENILSNAMKYSPEGASVNLRVAREGDRVDLVVVDRGIGIPEEDRPRLFDGFHRARNAAHISGTGLGLSVVKRSVELHGGAIRFTSEVGKGTTFRISLLAPQEAP
jgi:signal transduction histidine kinase